MSYVNINTLEKVESSDIIASNPEVSFPNRAWTNEDLAPYGYAELRRPSEHPIPGLYENLVESTPAKIGEDWYIQYELVPMSEEDIAGVNSTIISELVNKTEYRLNEFAGTHGYYGILSLCTYATSSNETFRAEGQRGVDLRDATWAKLYEIIDEIKSGERQVPESYDDIVDEMPALVWETV